MRGLLCEKSLLAILKGRNKHILTLKQPHLSTVVVCPSPLSVFSLKYQNQRGFVYCHVDTSVYEGNTSNYKIQMQ